MTPREYERIVASVGEREAHVRARSVLGEEQARELRERYARNDHADGWGWAT